MTMLLFTILCLVAAVFAVVDDLYNAALVADVDAVSELLRLKEMNIIVAGKAPIVPNNVEGMYSRTALMMCGFNPESNLSKQIDAACVSIGKKLLDAGANLYHTDNMGWNALHMASIRGLTKFARFLIQKSRLIERTSQSEHPNSSQHFIDLQDEDGRSALLHAISNGHLSTVKMLVKEGANVTQGDGYGTTAVHYAVQASLHNRSYVPILKWLLQATRKDTTPTTDSKALSSPATAAGNSKQRYLDAASIDAKDADGRSALMYAVIGTNRNCSRDVSQQTKHNDDSQHTEYQDENTPKTEESNSDGLLAESVVALLLEGGANPMLLDGFGVSAVAMAGADCRQLRELLANAAADYQLNLHHQFHVNLLGGETLHD